MPGQIISRQVPRQYEDLGTEDLDRVGRDVHPLLSKALQSGIRHRRLLAEGVNSALLRAAGSDAGSEQPSGDTTISTANYVSLTGLSFTLVTPAACRGMISVELDYTTTTQGTLWVQVWIGGAPVRTRADPSVLGLTFGNSAYTGSFTVTAPVKTFTNDSSRTVDVKCKAEDSGAFKVLATSLVTWQTLPIDEGAVR